MSAANREFTFEWHRRGRVLDRSTRKFQDAVRARKWAQYVVAKCAAPPYRYTHVVMTGPNGGSVAIDARAALAMRDEDDEMRRQTERAIDEWRIERTESIFKAVAIVVGVVIATPVVCLACLLKMQGKKR